MRPGCIFWGLVFSKEPIFGGLIFGGAYVGDFTIFNRLLSFFQFNGNL